MARKNDLIEELEDYKQHVKQECIHCDACKRSCPFLTKYDLVLADFADREDLRYSCFLCDLCKQVCPKDLDGGKLALLMRRINTKNDPFLYWRFHPYKFRNLTKQHTKDVLFLGCNFPGYFPETTELLISIFADYGFDFTLDCCKRPIEFNGDDDKVEDSAQALYMHFKQQDIERVVCACPNCYETITRNLENREDAPEIITIYQWLEEHNIGEKDSEQYNVFKPCPERFQELMLEDIRHFMPNVEPVKRQHCCGAGGLAFNTEPEIAEELRVNATNHKEVYPGKELVTYCSTCAARIDIAHVLPKILGTDERSSSHYPLNLVKHKFKRHPNIKD